MSRHRSPRTGSRHRPSRSSAAHRRRSGTDVCRRARGAPPVWFCRRTPERDPGPIDSSPRCGTWAGIRVARPHVAGRAYDGARFARAREGLPCLNVDRPRARGPGERARREGRVPDAQGVAGVGRLKLQLRTHLFRRWCLLMRQGRAGGQDRAGHEQSDRSVPSRVHVVRGAIDVPPTPWALIDERGASWTTWLADSRPAPRSLGRARGNRGSPRVGEALARRGAGRARSPFRMSSGRVRRAGSGSIGTRFSPRASRPERRTPCTRGTACTRRPRSSRARWSASPGSGRS